MVIGSDITPLEGAGVPSNEVFDLMMKQKCWEFTGSAPHLTKMKNEDTLLFYLGGSRAKYFAGEAKVAGEFEKLGPRSGGAFDRSKIPFFVWRVPIDNIRRYPPGQAGLEQMMHLSFVPERITRPFIGLVLRVGVRQITQEDVDLIRKAASVKV